MWGIFRIALFLAAVLVGKLLTDSNSGATGNAGGTALLVFCTDGRVQLTPVPADGGSLHLACSSKQIIVVKHQFSERQASPPSHAVSRDLPVRERL